MKVGDLVTWLVDYKEFTSKSRLANKDLEVGIVFTKKEPEDYDPIHDQILMVGVFWFNSKIDQCSWIPINNLVKIS